MISYNPQQSIVYARDERPGAVMPALLAWTGLLFGLALLPLLHYLVLRPGWSPLGPFPWHRFSRPELWVVAATFAGGLMLWGLFHLLLRHLGDLRDREMETLNTLLALQDATALQRWDGTLLAAPAMALPLALFGWVGPAEVLLCIGISAGIGAGSRVLRRFPREEEKPRFPYSEERVRELFEAATGEAAASQEYRWRFKEHSYLPVSAEREFSFTIPFNRARYDEALAKAHDVRTEHDYARFVREDLTCEEVVMVAARLKEVNEAQGYARFQQVGNVLAFMRQFDYAYDQDTRGVIEYPRYPVEMLWDREGDCECQSILAAALLVLLGFDAILLVLDFEKGPGHVAVGIAGADGMPEELRFYELDGKRYFYCEATSPVGGSDGGRCWEWNIGVIPFEEPTRVAPVPLSLSVEPQ